MAGVNGAANGTIGRNGGPIVPVKTRKPSLFSRASALLKATRSSASPPASYPYQPGNDDHTPQTGLLEDIEKLGFKDYQSLLKFLNAAVSGINNDDTLLQEGLVQVLAKLPHTSKQCKELTDGFIAQLWGTLDHPPISSLGAQYKYRQADGSFNNVHMPLLGAAKTAYARTTQPMLFQNPDLPEPGQIFDVLMARGGTFTGHPNGISSMLFYMATLIIHDIFQTSSEDYNINLTSSYLDLSPLYGRNEDEQKLVRTFHDGLLKPDCFSSTRILGFPPGCGVFLIMFNRFHNYVVTQLARINENGRFTKPHEGAPKASWEKYDHELFQTGRLITCGLYVNVVLRDYVRTILSLNRTDSGWALDPRTKEGKNLFSKGVQEGVGNQVSAEFNLIYRWHSTISQRDEKWTIDEFKRLLPGKDPATATMNEVLGALHGFEKSLPAEPEKRSFGGLARQPDGTFSDDDMVKILAESVEDLAGSFGPNRVPTCMRSIEILGIIQARYWNLATLNELRQFFGLTRHATFEDINPDPDVVQKLKQFYDSPDAVELYPGLLAEKTKPPMTPGSGLCVNYTTSWAILSDATALVRGDRFYTIDYTPKNLTNWGYNEVNYDANVDGGHVMSKLIFRAFPQHFRQDSIYAHFPFVIPTENRRIQKSLGTPGKYSWDQPQRQSQLIIIKSSKACQQILDNQKDFRVVWGEPMVYETMQDGATSSPAANFCLAGDAAPNTKNRAMLTKAMYPAGWHDEIRRFFAATTTRLLEQYAYYVPSAEGSGASKTFEADIIRDIIGLATTHFMAALFDLPMKTAANPRGVYSEQEMFQALIVMFSAVFFDSDIANSFKLRNAARDVTQQLGALVLLNARAVAAGELVEGALDALKASMGGHAGGSATPSLRLYGEHMIRRLVDKGKSVQDVVWGTIIPTSTAGVANQTQNLAQALEYYLGDGKEHLAELYRLANEGTEEADNLLMKYMLEGCRLRATVAVYRNAATDQAVTDYSPSVPDPADPSQLNPAPATDPQPRAVTIPAGARVLVDLIAANHDAATFPDPEAVRLDRPLDSYMQFGWGPHECLGRDASRVGLAALFKTIVGKRNLRPAPGGRGAVKSFPATTWSGQVGGREQEDGPGWTGLRAYMTADQSSYWPMPTTWKVRWDE